MYFRFRDIQVFYKARINQAEGLNVLFIHGFTGDSSDWDEIDSLLDHRHNYFYLDLPGCGKSDKPASPDYYTQQGLRELISEFLSLIIKKKVVLCGYSMGGRIALSVATSIHHFVTGLILESTSPGLSDEEERAARIKSDIEWIGLLDKEGVRFFTEKWMETELFRRLRSIMPGEKYGALVAKKSSNSSLVLINYLKEFGTGIMSHLWGSLEDIDFPVLLLSGGEDIKYSSIMRKMQEKMSSAEWKSVENCGHNIHIEQPLIYSQLINNFLDKVNIDYESEMENS